MINKDQARACIVLPREQYDQLRLAALQRRVSFGALVRAAIAAAYPETVQPAQPAASPEEF